MPTTANGLWYPVLGAANNPPTDFQTQGEAIDNRYGLTVANTAALAGISTPYDGMRVWVTSLLRHAVYDSTDWTWANKNLDSITTSSTATTGTTELTLATSDALTFDGITEHEISFNWYSFTQSDVSGAFVVRLYDGTDMIGQSRVGSALSSPGGLARAVTVPDAGSHTFTARVLRGAGAGTAALFAQSDAPAQLLVRPTA